MLDDIGRKKGLDVREVFLCTYKMVSEIIADSGSFRAETLFDLVVKPHCLCIKYRCQVRFIHVAVTPMIGQGIDGLSRGSLYEGVMNGEPMLSLLPLRESVLKRSKPLGRWIEKWDSQIERSIETIDPEVWFARGHYHD